MIPLYTRRGFDVSIQADEDKWPIFQAPGARRTECARDVCPWFHPARPPLRGTESLLWANKAIGNVSAGPLPHIGTPLELSQEYIDVKLNFRGVVSAEADTAVRSYSGSCARPLVCFHPMGNTSPDKKDVTRKFCIDFYTTFVESFGGTLVILDWDDRVPVLDHKRLVYMGRELPKLPLPELHSLIDRSDAMVAVDSGPMHFARFTETPVIGVWTKHHPAHFVLPRRNSLNITDSSLRDLNGHGRTTWNILEHDDTPEGCGPLVSALEGVLTGKDPQDMVLENMLGLCKETWDVYKDRHLSFKRIVDYMKINFTAPTVVETGTIRMDQDWAGAGFFTYWMSFYLSRKGGRLYSIDNSPSNVRFARERTALFNSVDVIEGDSVEWLAKFAGEIHVLYLDSLDTDVEGHQNHNLRELEAAYSRLSNKAIVVIDDIRWRGGLARGKGELSIPWLFKRGWRVLFEGYQVIMCHC